MAWGVWHRILALTVSLVLAVEEIMGAHDFPDGPILRCIIATL